MKKIIFSLFLIMMVGIIAYSNTFNSPFVFDDEANIADNPLIRKLDNFIFPTGGYKGYLPRAVGFFTFALNYHFSGLDVTGYHIVNLVIHITNAILVYFLVILTFKTPFLIRRSENENSLMIALFSGLLFVSHPLQTQAVTYTVQRLTSLATMFYLLSVVMYIKARLTSQEAIDNSRNDVRSRKTHKTIGFSALALLSAILSMLTKEISFTLPIIVILYEFTFFRSSLKKKLLFTLPIILTLIIIPLSIMGIDKPLGEILSDMSEKTRVQTEISRWDYLFTQFRVIVTYIRLIFLPINQNLDYDYPVYHSLFSLPVSLSFIFLLSILGIATCLFYRSRIEEKRADNHYTALISFGILWFFLTLSVESSIIPIVDVIFEHRLYLPSVGAFIAISTFVYIITARLKVRWLQTNKIAKPLCALIVILLSITTYARNTVWKDKITLWEDVVSKSPKNARANNNLGASYYEKGSWDSAIGYLSIAVSLKPDYVDAYNNLGISYYEKGYNDLAKKQLVKAMRFAPNDAGTFNNLSIIYASEGLYDQAIEYAQRALALNPDYAEAHNSLGVAYGSKEMYYKALEQFSLALRLKPDYFEADNNLLIVQKKLQPLKQ